MLVGLRGAAGERLHPWTLDSLQGVLFREAEVPSAEGPRPGPGEMPSGQARANPRPGLPQESDRERCPGLLLSRPLAPCAPLPLFDRVRKGCSRCFLSATPCRRKAGGTSPGATAQVLGCGCLVLKHFACTRSARMAVTWGGAPAVLGRTVTKRTTLCQGQGGSSGSSGGMRQGDGVGGRVWGTACGAFAYLVRGQRPKTASCR